MRSTLKITSAMKLVASSKLHKAQKAIEGLRPYADSLKAILSEVESGAVQLSQQTPQDRVAIIAVSSNSSLCGAFNVNVVKAAMEEAGHHDSVIFFPIGKKMLDAVRKAACEYEDLGIDFISHPSYERNAEFAHSLIERFQAGEFSKVMLVFNSFVSASVQRPHSEQFLPYQWAQKAEGESHFQKYIYEPQASQIVTELLPQLLCLQFHAAILDSVAAEQAARTIAMQTATDNAEKLLAELTLEYNKGRQQKITNEILDLVGGSLQ